MSMAGFFRWTFAALLLVLPAGALAQLPRVQTEAEALAQDAGEYAKAQGVSLEEAMRRLRAQQESVAATDRIQQRFKDRLAGLVIEHRPEYRIVVLLTGDEPVADEVIAAGGMQVPVVFRTGARATRDEIVEAMKRRQAAIRAAFPNLSGMGPDQRTGELVVMVRESAAARYGTDAMRAKLEEITGVPVRLRLIDRDDVNSDIEGGARVVGVDPANGKRYACTTGFVVTDGAQTGVVTAAHCPDTLTYLDPGGGEIPLAFGGQWGWSYQDVQLHVSERAQKPLFYADTAKKTVREVATWRNRVSVRPGDIVCRRGETTGYSCSEVELVDYAPPGDLCGGPCAPTWVSVTGPSCKAGDSGGPVFSRTVAFGIVKGGNYNRDGSCNYYYFMSTDYLPAGWTLLHR
ncbi:MAG TPA: hypothetical protein VGD10_05770 [Allosphingosinicella sp.]|uniref:hypothetical protein n=1 Tax=Allosphingosinicella sp. TaxID=2823234 RepID=UPI002ED77BB8